MAALLNRHWYWDAVNPVALAVSVKLLPAVTVLEGTEIAAESSAGMDEEAPATFPAAGAGREASSAAGS